MNIEALKVWLLSLRLKLEEVLHSIFEKDRVKEKHNEL